jgi:hypothetical protein
MRRAIRKCKAAGVSRDEVVKLTEKNVHAAARKQGWLKSETATTMVEWRRVINEVYNA